MDATPTSVAEALLLRLGTAGVPYLFANAGTDAAPIIEAYARIEAEGSGPVPIPIVVAHEMAAMSLAHGYAMTTGRPAAVFVHVTVGTANAAIGIMNASRQQVPILVLAGRTPIVDDGTPGSRDMYIHWAQESFDQAAMVREYTRWDYELRDPGQVDGVVSRALAMAIAEPAGPVYLSLPRELLTGPAAGQGAGTKSRRLDAESGSVADPEAVGRAADLIANAEAPLVITNSAGRDPRVVAALVKFAETSGAGVVEVFRERISFPASHPHHLGFDSSLHLVDSDLIVVVDADVPWLPANAPSSDVKVVHIGADPLHRSYPMWGFPVDIALAGSPRATLEGLTQALAGRIAPESLAERSNGIAALHDAHLAEARNRAEASAKSVPIDPAFLSRSIANALGPNAIVVNEYDVHSDQLGLDEPGSFFSASSVSGLGWGFGAALGAKLGSPERTVVCALGDGAYIFSNPVACHMAAQHLGLSLLVVVFNNGRWNAVRESVQQVAPVGWAVSTDNYPLTELAPAPAYSAIALACGAYAEEVDSPGDLEGALERAVRHVEDGQGLALLDVRCA